MSENWREQAIDRVVLGQRGNQWLLGEDERGDLWAPSLRRRDWWSARFNPRNPLHWPFWLWSRTCRKIAMIEVYS